MAGGQRGKGRSVGPGHQEERRTEIAETAARLFANEGVARVNMDRIAAEVGIAKPTLYHYFTNRDEILIRINEETFDFLFKRIAAREPLRLTPVQELRAIYGDVLDLVNDLPGYARVVFEHLRQLQPEPRTRVLKRRQAYREHIVAVLRDGMDRGEFRQMDVRLASLAVLGIVTWTHEWFEPDGRSGPREVADLFFDIATHGIIATD